MDSKMIRSSRLCLPLMVLALAISTGTVDGAEGRNVKPTFTMYLFEQFVTVPGAELTNVLSAAPSGNTSSYEFGNFGVSEQIIRESASDDSKIIGRAPGWFSPHKENGIFNLQKLITLNTEKYNGTLIVFADFDSNTPTNEFAIVGGTGSFRLASGWTTTLAVVVEPTHIIYRWDVYLKKCKLYQ